MTDLPPDIVNALTLFESAFDHPVGQDQARMFKNAVYLTNDCMATHPRYREDIQKLRYAYTLRLLSSLGAGLDDYDAWLEFVLLFCIDLKVEIITLRNQAPALFDQTLSFLRLYDQTITPELKTNITRFIDEVTGQSDA
ncbi:hypothetical protein JCM14469_22150 [Desulfatiferula olefinivorans]